MADTALTIITDALLDLGVLADEEPPTASQAQGGLRKLNNMLASWNIEGLLVYGATSYTLPLVANKAVYTIGSGGDLNIPYPDNITAAYLQDTTLPAASRQDIPLYLYNNDEWAANPFKTQTAQYPNWGVWFNYTYPLIQAYVSPIPTTAQYQIIIWADNNLNDLTLNGVINLAPGYKRAVTSNLCIELAPSYAIPVPDTITAVARDSKAKLKTKNLQINELTPNFGGGYYDIRSNRYLN